MKAFVKRSLARMGLEVRRIPSELSVDAFTEYIPGEKPFTEAYRRTKWSFIERVIADPSLMSRFATGAQLPERFGLGLDESCV